MFTCNCPLKWSSVGRYEHCMLRLRYLSLLFSTFAGVFGFDQLMLC